MVSRKKKYDSINKAITIENKKKGEKRECIQISI